MHDTSNCAHVHHFRALVHVAFFLRSRKISHDLIHADFINLRARLHVRGPCAQAPKNGARLMKSWIVGFGNDGVTLKEQLIMMCFWRLLDIISFKKIHYHTTTSLVGPPFRALGRFPPLVIMIINGGRRPPPVLSWPNARLTFTKRNLR